MTRTHTHTQTHTHTHTGSILPKDNTRVKKIKIGLRQDDTERSRSSVSWPKSLDCYVSCHLLVNQRQRADFKTALYKVKNNTEQLGASDERFRSGSQTAPLVSCVETVKCVSALCQHPHQSELQDSRFKIPWQELTLLQVPLATFQVTELMFTMMHWRLGFTVCSVASSRWSRALNLQGYIISFLGWCLFAAPCSFLKCSQGHCIA